MSKRKASISTRPNAFLRRISSLSLEKFLEEVQIQKYGAGSMHGVLFKPPKLNGRLFHLQALFLNVVQRGGYHKVTGKSDWDLVAESLHLPASCSHAANNVRSIYQHCLLDYEELHADALGMSCYSDKHVISNEPYNTLDDNFMTTQPKRSAMDLFNCEAYRPNQGQRYAAHRLLEHRNNVCLSATIREGHDLQHLILSLMSGLPNEIDFALNSLLLVSQSNADRFILANCGPLLTLLCAVVGVLDEEHSDYYEQFELWSQLTHRKYDEFWEQSSSNQMENTAMLGTAAVGPSSDLGMLASQWDPLADSQLHSECVRDNYRIEYQNVLTVCSILHNVCVPVVPCDGLVHQFCANAHTNARHISESGPGMRLVLALCYSRYSTLRSFGLNLMTSLGRYTLSHSPAHTLALMHSLIMQPDRFTQLRGMEMLSAVVYLSPSSTTPLSLDVAGGLDDVSILPVPVLCSIMDCLLLDDFRLVLCALETLRVLADSLLEAFVRFPHSHALVSLLVAFLTRLEFQWSNKASKGVRIHAVLMPDVGSVRRLHTTGNDLTPPQQFHPHQQQQQHAQMMTSHPPHSIIAAHNHNSSTLSRHQPTVNAAVALRHNGGGMGLRGGPAMFTAIAPKPSSLSSQAAPPSVTGRPRLLTPLRPKLSSESPMMMMSQCNNNYAISSNNNNNNNNNNGGILLNGSPSSRTPDIRKPFVAPLGGPSPSTEELLCSPPQGNNSNLGNSNHNNNNNCSSSSGSSSNSAFLARDRLVMPPPLSPATRMPQLRQLACEWLRERWEECIPLGSEEEASDDVGVTREQLQQQMHIALHNAMSRLGVPHGSEMAPPSSKLVHSFILDVFPQVRKSVKKRSGQMEVFCYALKPRTVLPDKEEEKKKTMSASAENVHSSKEKVSEQQQQKLLNGLCQQNGHRDTPNPVVASNPPSNTPTTPNLPIVLTNHIITEMPPASSSFTSVAAVVNNSIAEKTNNSSIGSQPMLPQQQSSASTNENGLLLPISMYNNSVKPPPGKVCVVEESPPVAAISSCVVPAAAGNAGSSLVQEPPATLNGGEECSLSSPGMQDSTLCVMPSKNTADNSLTLSGAISSHAAATALEDPLPALSLPPPPSPSLSCASTSLYDILNSTSQLNGSSTSMVDGGSTIPCHWIMCLVHCQSHNDLRKHIYDSHISPLLLANQWSNCRWQQLSSSSCDFSTVSSLPPQHHLSEEQRSCHLFRGPLSLFTHIVSCHFHDCFAASSNDSGTTAGLPPAAAAVATVHPSTAAAGQQMGAPLASASSSLTFPTTTAATMAAAVSSASVMSVEKEFPLTKHIRITAALILRSLSKHPIYARDIRRHELDLVNIAFSNQDCSLVVNDCLRNLHGAFQAS